LSSCPPCIHAIAFFSNSKSRASPRADDSCAREIEDCPDCSDGCTPFEVGDGTCNPECYNPLCSFDQGDCYYCGAECVSKMGDGHCDAECYIGACELDGGDCNVCNAATGCLNSLVNNGICDKQCFNFECDFDGQDCYHCDLRPECSDRFVGDGICDYDWCAPCSAATLVYSHHFTTGLDVVSPFRCSFPLLRESHVQLSRGLCMGWWRLRDSVQARRICEYCTPPWPHSGLLVTGVVLCTAGDLQSLHDS